MWLKLWALAKKHPQSVLSSLSSFFSGFIVILPSIITSVRVLAGITLGINLLMLVLAQWKNLLDKIKADEAVTPPPAQEPTQP